MGGIKPGLVVLVAIVAAAGVVAMGAAIHKVYSGKRGSGQNDLETQDSMLNSISNDQLHYMRDVRMRGQMQAWGIAPGYEEGYEVPKSQLGRMDSRGTHTEMSYG